MDLIERNVLLAELRMSCKWHAENSRELSLLQRDISIVREQPGIDAEPVRHGHWKPFDEDEYTCSLCGNIFVTMDGEHPLSNGFKFCPFCGAKMDGEEE